MTATADDAVYDAASGEANLEETPSRQLFRKLRKLDLDLTGTAAVVAQGTSEEADLAVEISQSLGDELLCFLALCLEHQKKAFTQSNPLEQIHAALPKISSSPHATLLDQFAHCLAHPLKYQKLTHLVQTEVTGSSKLENGTVMLSMEEWGQIQMLANVLVQQHDEPLLHVLLAKCILRRKEGKVLEAVEWARRGLSQCCEETPQRVTELVKKALAIALSTAGAKAILSQPERAAYRTEALELLTELSESCEEDASILYNLSVVLAENTKYAAATKAIKAAMACSSGSFDPAWILYALILSANRDYETALTVIDGGLAECSKLYEPLLQMTKARLLAGSGSPNEGINLLTSACDRFKRKQRSESDSPNWREVEREQQAALLMELTRLNLSQERVKDAEYSLLEMEHLVPLTPDVLTLKGDVHHAHGRTHQAIQQYEMALSIDPNHEAATLSLGRLYRLRGEESIRKKLDGSADLVLAHSLLYTHVQEQDASRFQGWYHLGLVCRAQGRLDEAKKHLQYATALAAISPVMSFRNLPRVF